tara:strand:+ start:1712 stop:3808 length:2097 start_codon:yes stop_codon:yes gene_type:complete
MIKRIKRYLNRNVFEQRKALNNLDFLKGNDASSNEEYTESKDFMKAMYQTPFTGHAIQTIVKDVSKLDYFYTDSQGNELNSNTTNEIDSILNNTNAGSLKNLIGILTSNTLLDKCVIELMYLDNSNELNINVLNPSTVTLKGENSRTIDDAGEYNFSHIDSLKINYGDKSKVISKQDLKDLYVIGGMQSLIHAVSYSGVIAQNKQVFENARKLVQIAKAWSDNGIVSNIFMSMKNEHISDKEFNFAIKALKKQYSGKRNNGKPLIMKGIDQVKELKTSNHEIQYLEQLKNVRENIYSAFGVPPIFYDASGQFASSLTEQSSLYHENTIPGYGDIVADIITEIIKKVSNLDTRLRKTDIRFKFRYNNYKTPERKLNEVKSLVDIGAMNRHEAREELGYRENTENPLNDTYTLPFSLTTAESIINTPVNTQVEDGKALHAHEGGCTHSKSLSVGHQRLLKLKRETLSEKKHISRFEKSITSYYKGLKERVINGLEKAMKIPNTKELDINDMFDFDAEVNEAQKQIEPAFVSIAVSALAITQKVYGKTPDSTDIAQPFKNPEFRLAIEALKIKYAQETLNTRRDELKAIIKTALDEGLSISETTVKIEDTFKQEFLDPDSRWKATRIARTEMGRGYDAGVQQGYKEAGFEYEMVVGCTEPDLSKWECAAQGESGKKRVGSQWNFKPNHTGAIVPVEKRSDA